MELTEEQKLIIASNGNIKINAVAGSGKTTTIIEYAKSRPPESQILYLAFNKTVKLEAQKKFQQKGLRNVQVETAHSLAYRHIVPKHHYTVKAQGYKIHELSEILGLRGNGEKHAEFILASHVMKFLAYYCNSDKEKIMDLNYLDVVYEKHAQFFVKNAYKYIGRKAINLFMKMDKGEIDITHDFYLKKFQLSQPWLKYDYILFDEGQDASAAMLDIFLRQSATKVIVGDTHQQIYGWRFAVNSLEKAEFKDYRLSQSFRFGEHIASLAKNVLSLKNYVGLSIDENIAGGGTGNKLISKAVIARSNMGLLLKAIEYVVEEPRVKRIYFEGNIHSYTYADEGASLYDVLHLYNRRNGAIKDKLIRNMRDLGELEDYIKKTEDMQLGMMVEIVKKYGNEIPRILRTIKDKHVDDKEKAEMIFSTVHRSKGMEYDEVELVNDFITEEKLEKSKSDKKGTPITIGGNKAKTIEEINLLYVGLTRTKNLLKIPEALLPKNHVHSDKVMVIKTIAEEKLALELPNSAAEVNIKTKAYDLDKIRQIYKGAYRPWTESLDMELTELFGKGQNKKALAQHFGRTEGAIGSRINKLNLGEQINNQNHEQNEIIR